jgi:hypothetical protein
MQENRMKIVNLITAKKFLVALILMGVIATFAGAQYGDGNVLYGKKPKDLTGTWFITITPGDPGAESFPGLYTFTSDGNVLFSSVGPPIPALGNPGHGTWVKTGSKTFAVTFKQFTFEENFQTNGSLIINSTITLNGADEFSSQDTGQILDVAGNEIFAIGGSGQGRRMKVEP